MKKKIKHHFFLQVAYNAKLEGKVFVSFEATPSQGEEYLGYVFAKSVSEDTEITKNFKNKKGLPVPGEVFFGGDGKKYTCI